jgi:Spy/CpxP family protein refolding chaperone
MEDKKMKNTLVKNIWLITLVLSVGLLLTGHALAHDTERDKGDRHHGYGWQQGHGYGHGYGQKSYREGHGCGGGAWPRGWHDMTEEQQNLSKKLSASYKMETLETRKKLATRQMELETLWAQPEVDQARIEKLSGEVADLKAQLWKAHDKYVVQCRNEFGDRGWECPGHGW